MAITRERSEVYLSPKKYEIIHDELIKNLKLAGYSKFKNNKSIRHLSFSYKSISLVGQFNMSFIPINQEQDKIVVQAIVNIDNIYSIFRSPSKKMFEKIRDVFNTSE